jgi:hypothetical protein
MNLKNSMGILFLTKKRSIRGTTKSEFLKNTSSTGISFNSYTKSKFLAKSEYGGNRYAKVAMTKGTIQHTEKSPLYMRLMLIMKLSAGEIRYIPNILLLLFIYFIVFLN